jgi:hypothetical protein
MSEFKIAEYVYGQAGLDLLSELTEPVPFPQASYKPYAEIEDLGDLTRLGVGWPSAEWRFPILTLVQRNQLREFCLTASEWVYIRTIDDGANYNDYLAVMVWPVDESAIQAGMVFDLVVRFEGLELQEELS